MNILRYIICNKKNLVDFKWFGENDRKSNGLKMLDFDLFWKMIEKRRGGGYKNCVYMRKLRILNVFFYCCNFLVMCFEV